MKKILLPALFILFASLPLYASDMCDLASDVAQKGMVVFEKDQKNGIKLLQKAHTMCSQPVYAYNLGQAYYVYGNRQLSEEYLAKAVKQDGTNPKWLNNYAFVLLENNSPEKAAKYAKAALLKDQNFKTAHETLAGAQILSGNMLEGLKTIKKASEKWSSSPDLARAKKDILKMYISFYLEQIQSGSVQDGLKGLEKAGSEPEAAAVYCRILLRLGKMDKALAASQKAVRKFPSNSEIINLEKEILSKKIQQFYIDFKYKDPMLALGKAKKFYQENPGSSQAKKAFDDLFEAFTTDALASSIAVPDAKRSEGQVTGAAASDYMIDRLVANIGTTPDTGQYSTDLTVDVDVKIPLAKMKNPHGIAFVLVNQDYSKRNRGIADVRYARRDGLVMKKYLEKALGYDPDNIKLMKNLTSGDFNSVFGTPTSPEGMIHKFVRKGRSDLFIYYAGHGSPNQKGDNAYLVPVDARADFIEHNGYPLDQLYKALERVEARNVTIVMDACFSGDSPSGSLFKNISPAQLKTVSPIREVANTAIFCAAGKDQVATWYPEKRHSLFTYYFLKGLQGEADKDSNMVITTGEMASYLKDEVKYMAGKLSNRVQTPLVSGKNDTVIAKFR